jgi:hypothetical protein
MLGRLSLQGSWHFRASGTQSNIVAIRLDRSRSHGRCGYLLGDVRGAVMEETQKILKILAFGPIFFFVQIALMFGHTFVRNFETLFLCVIIGVVLLLITTAVYVGVRRICKDRLPLWLTGTVVAALMAVAGVAWAVRQ